MILFFDTETTGLPKDWKAPASDGAAWPRLVQLGWILVDEKTGDQVVCGDMIVRPEGFEIPKEASDVHGITTEEARELGLPLEYVMQYFTMTMNIAHVLVAHNISFDEKVLAAEMHRTAIFPKKIDRDRVCTMRASAEYCQIPQKYGRGGYKFPKLQELHVKLFEEEFSGAHDAFADIQATVRCYNKLKELKLV